jgi:hypothetical protein
VIEPLLSASSNGRLPGAHVGEHGGRGADEQVGVLRRPALGRDLAVVDAELEHVALEVRNWKRA